jgi:hypothetical protein
VIDDDNVVIVSDPKHDPRIEVTIPDDTYPWPLVLYFESLADDSALVGLKLGTDEQPFREVGFADIQRLASNLALYVHYAHAWFAADRGEVRRSLDLLSEVGRTRRGLPGRFLKTIANEYNARVAAGDPAPITAIAEAHGKAKSTASRWVSAARARGWVDDEGPPA